MSLTARKVSLTGIKPTGEPHLGNYIGAILPALSLADSYDSVYFIADYHALTTIRDRDLLQHYTRSVAASWLAPRDNVGRAVLTNCSRAEPRLPAGLYSFSVCMVDWAARVDPVFPA